MFFLFSIEFCFLVNNNNQRFSYFPSTTPPPVVRLFLSADSRPSYRHYSIPNRNPQNRLSPSIYSSQVDEQLKRERQRRIMIDRMLVLFDDDGRRKQTFSVFT